MFVPRFKRTAPPSVPSPSLLAGHFHTWNEAPFEFAQMCERDHFGIAGLRFFHKTVFLVTDPLALEQIFVSSNKSFHKGIGHEEPRALFGEGLLTADGDTWRSHRKILNPFFHSSRMEGYGKLIEASARTALATWRDGEIRNVYRDLNALCLDVLLRSFVGREVPGAIETVGQAVRLMQTSHNRWSYGSRAFRAAVRRFDAFIGELIESLRSDDPGRKDLVNVLLREHAVNPGVLTKKHVRDQVATMILAGFETTASAITWALYLLARHPAVVAELRAELDAGEGAISEGGPESLPFLSQVLTESLRLYPPAHRLTRRAIDPVRIGGYSFAAGSEFIIPVWAVQRSARHYRDPERFEPRRWTPALKASLPRFAYFPFGGGPRACIGQGMALREMTIIVASVVSRFDLATASPGEKLPYNGITLLPDGGELLLRVRARRQAALARPATQSFSA